MYLCDSSNAFLDRTFDSDGRGGREGGKAERKRDRVLENQRDRTTTRDDEYRTVKIAYISRVRANPPAVHPKPSRACTRVYVCVCLHPHSPQLAVDIKYVSH